MRGVRQTGDAMNRSHRSLWIVILAFVASLGCFPYSGSTHKASRTPVRFVDAETGAPLSKVLVFPLYGSRDGHSAERPRGGSGSSAEQHLAHPSICRSGDSLSFRPAGSRHQVDLILLVPPYGYRAHWIDDHNSPPETIEFAHTTPGKEAETRNVLKAWLTAAPMPPLDFPYAVRLTDDERQLVEEFFAEDVGML